MSDDVTDLKDFDQIGSRWPAFLIDEFKIMRPVAVWVAGSRDLVSVTVHHPNGSRSEFGTGNRACRAIKLGLSAHWRDEVSKQINRVPYFEQRLLARVWTKNDEDAKLLMLQAVQSFADAAEPTELLKDWIDIGPDVPLTDLAAKLTEAAHASLIEHWSDHALVTHLLSNARRRRSIESRQRGVVSGHGFRVMNGGRR